jgi:Ala-tRNA(Pro) deacylase
MPCEKLLEYLDEHGIDYEFHEHPRAYAAEDVARSVDFPRRSFAKTVLVKLDGIMAMAVVSASFKINFNLLRDAAGAGAIALALEEDFAPRFPDCELGAMPPFGNLYGMDVYADGELAASPTIAFNAGTHREVLTMAWDDFEVLVEPRVARFAYQSLQADRALW